MTDTLNPRLALSKQKLQEVILAKLDECINTELSQLPDDYSVQEVADQIMWNATQAKDNKSTEEKVFSVGFSYSEQGAIYIKANSPEEAEQKLFQLLGEEGLEGLCSRYDTIFRNYDTYDAEEV